MICANYIDDEFCWTVGDPVDVVTGANIDRNLDFKLAGPLPFEWRRYYNSSLTARLCPLGWGHTHEYDRRLMIDVDGVSYVGPSGKPVGFPALQTNGGQAARSGLVLLRAASDLYQVHESGAPSMEFTFGRSSEIAQLTRIFRGNSSIGLHYASDGYLAGIADSRGRSIRVRHDDSGRVVELALLGERAEENRRILACVYDEAGDLVRCIDPYGNPFSFKYDRDHRMISKADRRGYSFHFEYDAQGRCIRSAGEDGLHEVRLDYFPKDMTTRVTRANGGQWTYFYDEAGRVRRVIDPHGGARVLNLAPNGQVLEEIDPNGNSTKWVHGTSGKLIGKLSSLGRFSAGQSDPVKPNHEPHRLPNCSLEWEYGELFKISKITRNDFDCASLGRLPKTVQELICDGGRGNTSWPAPGNIPSSGACYGTGSLQSRSYDDFGLPFHEAGRNGSGRRWSYDAGGNTLKYRDRDGAIYKYEYASWDLRNRKIDPLGQSVSYSYTQTAQLAKVIDPGGATSEYVYDLKDRLVEVWRDGILKEKYRYDKADNLIEKLDGKGNSLLSFEIGRHNLKTFRLLASGESHHFAYDKQGRYSELATNESKVSFEYDRFGNRTVDERDGLGVKHRFAGPRKLLSATVFERFTTTYRYPSDNTVLITDPGGKQHSIYLVGCGLITRTVSNGTSEVTKFDDAGRCVSKAVARVRSAGRAWVRSYSYSGEGDLLRVDDNVNGNVQYECDAAHRLVKAVYANGTQRYGYDAASNLIEQPGLHGVIIDHGNQLRAANDDLFEYNDRRHVAARRGQRGETRYDYDSRDMLVRVETPRGDWRTNYDPLGRRTHKLFEKKKVDFYWDTDRLAAEVHEDGRLRIYIYSGCFAMTPLLFVEYENINADPISGSRYFVFSNHLGAPVRVEDEQGKVAWSANLDPYGTAHISETARVEMPLRFPGHYFDAETGLHYNRFRYYSPELGRYLQSDPLGVAGGINLYAYPSNPLKLVDVRGLCPEPPPTEEDTSPSTGEEGSDGEKTTVPAEEGWSAKPRQDPEDPPRYGNVLADMSEGARERDARLGVTILADDEREQYRVVANDDGQLVWNATGEPVDTGDHPAIYVMDQDGNIFVHPDPEDGQIHHSSLANGQPVAGAGEMQVIQGQPVQVDDKSGHYGGNLPDGAPGRAKNEMNSQGVDTANTDAQQFQS